MTKQVVFFGSSEFSVIVLEKLLNAQGLSLCAVVTTPDKPVGRHLKLTPNPVKVCAQKHHNIPVFTDIHDFLSTNLPTNTIALVAAHGRRLGPKTLSKFNNQIYVIHPSLLPKYRGPSPLQQQILDGAVETGVTIIQADLGEDTGPIVAQEKDVILPNDTTITLGNRLFEIGANWFIENSFQISNFKFQIQDQGLATFTKKLTRQDGFIPWEQFHPEKLDRQFRAFIPWPGVWTTTPQGQRLKLIALQPQILVQLEGKTVQPWPIVV
ncbi:MAG: Methionyl-tRNA formyltransferase [Candidatus Amesbacteria bacterium GW2011_GWA2_47_11b]|uniref:methionyl-tRNA formyltransferase n=1 Tax=Candidatus Amesbacteria bacterium GW2011_GWA2_47_11b TaxID=1618358 RepID=A0A0G1RHU5_9BACT|nr:MAG: Methionyl-tRNA formyltransferase [Candidatus Amesbacteria bacterium GW2011_GWA2_47_11b]